MLLTSVQPACSIVAIVGVECLTQLIQGHATRAQPRRIGNHLVAPYHATQGIHVGNAGDSAQGRPYHPVQHTSAFGQRVALAINRKHEHLAQRRGDGGQPPFCGSRQVALYAGQPFGDLLASPVDVRAFREVHGHVADAVLGNRAHDGLVRQTQQLLFHGGGDALLHLFRRHARHLQDHFDLGW